MKNLGIYFIIFSLIGVLFCSISGKAAGDEKVKSEQYYRELEKQYVENVKEYLAESGLENSGVMLTKVIYDSQTREYTLSIHNKGISFLTESQKAELIRTLKEMQFEESGCTFSQVFPG